MKPAQRWKRSLLVYLLIALVCATSLRAQTVRDDDDTVLEQIIIFGRHGVRSNAVPTSTLAAFATRPYPEFSVPPGFLTPRGYEAQMLLGAYCSPATPSTTRGRRTFAPTRFSGRTSARRRWPRRCSQA